MTATKSGLFAFLIMSNLGFALSMVYLAFVDSVKFMNSTPRLEPESTPFASAAVLVYLVVLLVANAGVIYKFAKQETEQA